MKVKIMKIEGKSRDHSVETWIRLGFIVVQANFWEDAVETDLTAEGARKAAELLRLAGELEGPGGKFGATCLDEPIGSKAIRG